VGEAALVGRDVDDGARLIQKIDATGFPVAAAIWVHNYDLDVWRLVIAISVREVPSPKAAYSLLQDAIIDLNLGISLDRISIVSDNDHLLRSLRELIRRGSSSVVEIPIRGAEIAGEPIDKGYGYRIEALRYQAEVFAALQRNQPEDAVLSRVGWLDQPSSQDLDFTLDNGEVLIFVETKALARPLGRRDVDPPSDVRHWTLSSFRRTSSWLVISQTGFTSDAMTLKSDLQASSYPTMRVELVEWSSQNDDPQLREGLNIAFGRSEGH
jgi:hypothetical protein